MGDVDTSRRSAAVATRAAAVSRTRALAVVAAGVAFSQAVTPLHAADPSAGERLFKPCSACHAVGPGAEHRFGPQLNGLFARGAGAAEGYLYSDAFSAAIGKGLSWKGGELDRYLEAPMEVMPGTKMAYPGLKDEEARASLIAWLSMIPPDGTLPSFEASVDEAAEEPAASSAATPSGIAPKDAPIPTHGVLHLGRAALPEEIVAWDIDVRPDGAGLPDGTGDVATGGELYDAQCAACHGVFGEGEGRWPVLAGGWDSLSEERPEKTIGSYWPYLSTVYDYVRRAMPFGNARSLSDDEVYALTAYLLYLNDLVDEEFTLSKENFTAIELPNEDGFIADTRPEEPWFEAADGAAGPCMSDCADGEATVAMRARVLDVTPDTEADEAEAGGLD